MKYKIEELCEINSENISKSDDIKYIYYLDTSNLTRGTINEIQKLIVGKDKLPSRAKRKVKVNDILISTVRPNQRHYGIIRKEIENLIVSTGFAVLSPNLKKVNPEYLYWYLTQDSIVNYLQSIAETSTSAYPSIKPSVIGGLEIDLPKLEEQKAIANILSTLDEKIETNNQINEKLEEMAQALFKHWFVDFEFPNENGKPYKSSGGEMVESELGMIPKGWEIKELNDVTEKANTGADAIKRAPIVDYDTGIKCVRVGDLSRGRTYKDWGYCEITEKDYKKFALQKNDIIISRTANIGLNIFVFEDMRAVFNNGLIRLKIKKSYEPLFIFALINSKAYFDYIFRINGETSTRPNMKIGYLLKYKFALPPNGIINSFVDVIKNIYAKVNLNNEENSRLIDIRDTLLPKLMSGEIRVPLDDEELSKQY
ncbi:restriction endonuclease subunit S [Heyndrickxia coagulans]|uniref:restriction endonuclease subunit S n=1 Tax=Heyndrickxia coagulans TaxID=1398 RepID=UPI001F1CE077|nr:restriction endonuclease subunit S [Heyndrickxia coagulans]UJZ87476.1 restriction endonuclease subunit S [Heyndrickxia coagulans]